MFYPDQTLFVVDGLFIYGFGHVKNCLFLFIFSFGDFLYDKRERIDIILIRLNID